MPKSLWQEIEQERKKSRVSPARKPSKPKKKSKTKVTAKPRPRDTVIPRYHNELVEKIRKAVKKLGKEAATHRFTLEEKKTLGDIVYQYKGQSIRTSENQIARISINFLIEDYRENGKNSILARVIERLNA